MSRPTDKEIRDERVFRVIGRVPDEGVHAADIVAEIAAVLLDRIEALEKASG